MASAYERVPEIHRLQRQVDTDVAEFTTEAPQLKDDAEYVTEQLEKLRTTPNQTAQQVGQRLMELRTYWQDQVYRETQKNALRDVRTLLQAQTTEYARKAGTSANELYRRNEMAKIRKRRKQWKDIKKTLSSMHAQNQQMRQLVVQSAQLQSATEADRQCQAATMPSQACRHKGAEDCAQDPHCAVVGSMCVTVQEPSRMELCDRFNDRVESEDRMCRAITQEAQCKDKCTWQLVASPFGKERQGACRAKVSEHFTWYRQNPPNLTMPLETTSSVRGYRTLEQPVAYDFQQPADEPLEVQAKQSIGTMLEFWRKTGQHATWEQVDSDPRTDQGKLRLYLPTYRTSVASQPDVKHWFKDEGGSFVEVPLTDLEDNAKLYPSALSARQIQQLTTPKLAKHWAAQKDHVVVRVPRQNTQVLGFAALATDTNITVKRTGQPDTNICQFHHNECLSAYGIQQGTHRVEPFRLLKPNVGQVDRERSLQYLRQLYSAVPQQLHDGVPEERPLAAQRPDADLSTIPGTTGMGPVEFARWKLLDDKKRTGQTLTESETKTWRRFDSIDNIKEQLLEYLSYYARPRKLGGGAENEWFIVSYDSHRESEEGQAMQSLPNRELVPIPNHLKSALQFVVTHGKDEETKTVSIWTQKQGKEEDSRIFLLQTDKVADAVTSCTTDDECQQAAAVCARPVLQRQLSSPPAVSCQQQASCVEGMCQVQQQQDEDDGPANSGFIVQTGYYALTATPDAQQASIPLRSLLGETLSKQSLKHMFQGIKPNSTLFEDDLRTIANDFKDLRFNDTNFILTVNLEEELRWTHADEKEEDFVQGSLPLDTENTFSELQLLVMNQGSTIHVPAINVKMEGLQLHLQPFQSGKPMLPVESLRELVPWTAVRLGSVLSWDALEGKDEKIRALFKCPCFLLQLDSNQDGGDGVPVPYKKRIYFRKRGGERQGSTLRLNEPPTQIEINPQQYDVYYMEEPAQEVSQQRVRRIMCQAAEMHMRAAAVTATIASLNTEGQQAAVLEAAEQQLPRQFVFDILTDDADA